MTKHFAPINRFYTPVDVTYMQAIHARCFYACEKDNPSVAFAVVRCRDYSIEYARKTSLKAYKFLKKKYHACLDPILVSTRGDDELQ